jgi:hypothetical protein
MSNTDTPATLFVPQPAPPTMKIVSDETDDGFIIINRVDFDPETMVDLDAPKPKRSRGAADLAPADLAPADPTAPAT